MDKKYIIGIVCIIAIAFVAIALALSGGDKGSETNDTIKVSDLKVSSAGYGMYDITCNIVPDKDYSYLEMVVVYYDSSGAIIEKNSLVWNISDVAKGQTLKVSGKGYITGDNTPSKAEVYIFDSVFGGGDLSDAIFKQTVEL